MSRTLVLSGQTLLDEEVLRSRGVTDFSRYSLANDDSELELDIYVD